MSDNAAPSAVSAHLLPSYAESNSARTHVEETLELFAKLRKPLLRYLFTFGIGVCDVEEIVQEAFLTLFKHLEAGKPQWNLQAWLFRVCHNLALKHLKNNRGAKKVIDTGDRLSLHVDVAPNPEERLLQSQRHERLQSVLRALSEQDRCCICLRAEGLRYREIGRILGMSLGAVSISLTRSLKRFERADD